MDSSRDKTALPYKIKTELPFPENKMNKALFFTFELISSKIYLLFVQSHHI